MTNLWERVEGKYSRVGARWFHRKAIRMPAGGRPVISFTFDDFPHSALRVGGEILKEFGARGTYYAALGLMGKVDSAGEMFEAEDILRVLRDGHELGCHTYDHLDSWTTKPSVFEKSIQVNRERLAVLVPNHDFRSFSYPISPPRIATKGRTSAYFDCCRGGGQTANQQVVDSNYLSAFFLEKKRDSPDVVHSLIEENSRKGGWLIFATHDVVDSPSPYGVKPPFFRDVVRASAESGAEILPVIKAWERYSRHS